jgi:hypothetical protein
MDQYAVQPTGKGGAPEAWMDDFAVMPTAVQAKKAAPYEAEGAPLGVRASVGSARPRDKLATIRAIYPDAVEVKGGNFIYTDPASGKRTLYNPKGLDTGDLPSVAREATEALAGAAGGLLGMPAGPAGMVAGAGLGTAAGGKMMDLARSLMGQPSTAAPVTDTAKDVMSGVAGELGGQAISRGISGAAKALIRPGADDTIAAAARTGVPLTASQVGRGPYAATEHSFANVLPYSKPQRAQSEFFDVASGKLEQARPQVPTDPVNLREAQQMGGAALKSGAARAYDKFKAARFNVDREFFRAIPSGVKAKLPTVQAAAAELQQTVAQSPGMQGEALAPALRIVDRLRTDLAANRGAIPMNLLRKTRTLLGQELETKTTTELTDEAQGAIRKLYAALNTDLKAAAQQVSPRAARLLERHDRLVKAFRGEDLGKESVAGSLDKIMRAHSDEAAWAALNNGTAGQARLRTLVRRMSDEEHRIVARATWERMATTAQGNPRGPTEWATQWKAMPRESKQMLFGKLVDIKDLDDLADVLRAQSEGAKFRNTSNTAYELQRADIMGNAAKLGLGAITGGTAAATGLGPEALIGAISSYGLAELLYHPSAIKGMVALAKGTGVPSTATRLGAQGIAAGASQ